MTFYLHRAERADVLARELGRILRTPLEDPFATELVAVPTQGVERWLAQTLSHQLGTSAGGRDGVCAGVDFVSSRRLTAVAVGAACRLDDREDPWRPSRSVWPLLAAMDSARGEEWSALLWSYLGDDEDADLGSGPEAGPRREPSGRERGAHGGRRWSTARRLADLFAGYARSRPAMVRDWLAGKDVDGEGRPLPPDRAWQAELWRRLRSEIGQPSPAERLAMACSRLLEEPDVTDLPPRLSLFGASRLAPDDRAVLIALAGSREVHLWLPHPSAVLWRRVAERAPGSPCSGPRSRDTTSTVPAHPLLAYLGRDARELQLTLAADGGAVQDLHHPPEDVEHRSSRDSAAPLLHLLQDDLRQDRPARSPGDRPLLRPDDRSLQLHVSHGPDRQVEVLRELLVGLLADDPTLEPRDIIVMCPDIETFAPLISASFGLHDEEGPAEHPGHLLRVRLADRALRQVNPLLAALSQVLSLADSRMEASALLDLCAFPPVAAKFAFSEDDLETMRDLVLRSGVRWGLSAEHRQDFAMGDFGQNTWAAGLDRLLLGVTMDETGQHYLGTALPLDDVDSSDVELVGRLAELLDRVRWLAQACRRQQSLADWVTLCRTSIELLTAVTPSDSWQLAHAYGELGGLAPLSGDDAETRLSLAEVRALLADSFRGRATRANFRTGTLTMCTMMPMRSVPHRVICLLGLDDGVFPRHRLVDGDDILAMDPWIGDRDARSEDRQLLLDAVLAAQEHLLVVCSGADPRTRATKPPAVPVGALLDALDATARTGDDRRVRDHITTHHPLQPFDVANFGVGSPDPADSRPISFDAGSLRGARAAQGRRSAPPAVYDAAGLPARTADPVVALDDLVRFFNHPVKALLKVRAGLTLGGAADEEDDQIPIDLDGLQRWHIGERLLKLHLEGADLDRLTDAEWRRGSLPPRAFGRDVIRPVVATVAEIAGQAGPFLAGTPHGRDVRVDLDEVTVTGTLATVHDDALVRVTYSKLAAKQRLQAWVELLALTAGHPDRDWRAVTVGKGGRSVLGPVPAGWARTVLADLVQLYRSGLDAPLPLAPKTAAEYAQLRRAGRSVTVFHDKLARTWDQERDRAYEAFFGTGVSWSQLAGLPAVPGEARGDLGEPGRFGTLARRVWHLLLESEVLT